MAFKLLREEKEYIIHEAETDVFDSKLEYEVNQALYISKGRLTNIPESERVATVTRMPSAHNPLLGFIRWRV